MAPPKERESSSSGSDSSESSADEKDKKPSDPSSDVVLTKYKMAAEIVNTVLKVLWI